jgi:Na+-transporting methylmalonyl-CoA/oxaloacetate decarboxylase gamma subunit
VSSSPVICSAFVLASLTLLVYVFNFSDSYIEREMTPKMVPATSAMTGVRKVRRWDEATTRKLAG